LSRDELLGLAYKTVCVGRKYCLKEREVEALTRNGCHVKEPMRLRTNLARPTRDSISDRARHSNFIEAESVSTTEDFKTTCCVQRLEDFFNEEGVAISQPEQFVQEITPQRQVKLEDGPNHNLGFCTRELIKVHFLRQSQAIQLRKGVKERRLSVLAAISQYESHASRRTRR
jgi:hypothetical protein